MHVFQERDYRYGAGVLIMRVELVRWERPDTYDGEEWYFVAGVQLNSTGAEFGRREVMVRARMLRIKRPPSPSAGSE